MKHYILIEVREREERNRGTDAGDMRKVIHEYAKERGFNISDMVFREDMTRVPFLKLVSPYKEIRRIFETINDEYKREGLLKPKGESNG